MNPQRTFTLTIDCEPGMFSGIVHIGDEIVAAEDQNEDAVIKEIKDELLLKHGYYDYDYKLNIRYR